MARKVLNANEGKILTNGEIYGKTIYLSEQADKNTFYEITEEEYSKIIGENIAENELN